MVGDYVLKYNRRRDTRMGDKMATRYQGPYVVHEILERGVYRLRDGGTILKQVVNATNLKRYYQQVSPSQSGPKPQSPKTSQSPRSPSTKRCKRILSLSPTDTSETAAECTNDGDILKTGGWLNDKIVDAINNLIASHIGSDNSQTTLLSQTAGGFTAVVGDHIHIMHDTNHWIACCYSGDVIKIADSAHRSISEYVTRQLKQLYPQCVREDGSIMVSILPCDSQPNGNDCGVYAAAFCFQWATGNDVSAEVVFTNTLMRDHLNNCLQKNELSAFPSAVVRRRGRKKQTTVKILI